MAEKIQIEFSANDADLIRAQVELEKKQADIAKQTRLTNAAMQEQKLTVSNTAKEYERAMKKISTPQSGYDTTLVRLNLLLKEGAISQEHFDKKLKEAEGLKNRQEMIRQQIGLLKEEQAKEKEAINTKEALAKASEKLIQSLKTPQQLRDDDVSRYSEMLKAGTITQEQFNAAVAKADDALKAQEDAMSGVADAAKAQEAELKKLEAIGKRVFEETRTPAEKLQAKMDELNKAYKAGTVDQESYRRKSEQIKKEMQGLGQEAVKTSGSLDKIGGFFKGQIGSLIGAVGLTASLGSMVGGAIQHRQQEGERNVSAFDQTVSNEQLQADFFSRLGVLKPGQKDSITQRVEGLRKSSGKSDQQLWYLLSQTAEGIGAVGEEQYFENLGQSLAAQPYDIQKSAEEAKKANQFTARTGGDLFAREAIMKTSQTNAGVTDATRYSKEAGALSEVMRGRGDSDAFALSIYESSMKKNKGAERTEAGIRTGLETIGSVLEGGQFGNQKVKGVKGLDKMSNEQMLDYIISDQGAKYRDEAIKRLQNKKGSEQLLAMLQGDQGAIGSYRSSMERNEGMFSDLGAASAAGERIVGQTYAGMGRANFADTTQDRLERMKESVGEKERTEKDAEIKAMKDLIDASNPGYTDWMSSKAKRSFGRVFGQGEEITQMRIEADNVAKKMIDSGNIGQAESIYEQMRAGNHLNRNDLMGQGEYRIAEIRANQALQSEGVGDDISVFEKLSKIVQANPNGQYEEKLVPILEKLNRNIEKMSEQNKRPPITANQATLGAPTAVGASEVPLGSPRFKQ